MHFREDNTHGFSAQELDTLNQALDTLLADDGDTSEWERVQLVGHYGDCLNNAFNPGMSVGDLVASVRSRFRAAIDAHAMKSAPGLATFKVFDKARSRLRYESVSDSPEGVWREFLATLGYDDEDSYVRSAFYWETEDGQRAGEFRADEDVAS